MKQEIERERELIYAEENKQWIKVILIKLRGNNMNKFKKIVKYTINILCMIGALITGINAIDGITIPYAYQIVQVISVLTGVFGTYLLGQKVIKEK